MATWSIFWLSGTFYDHLVYFVVIWYIFPRFGMVYQENLATLYVAPRKILKPWYK
jgi:hypothetical protein